MKQLRRKDVVDNSSGFSGAPVKETRWDRIRKRCTAGVTGNGSAFSLKTEAVRRFIEADYIGKRNISMLQDDKNARNVLDPTLVMDMRHKMKIPKKLPLATVAAKQQNNVQSCRTHNMAVEQRFIDNELNKLRQQLEKERKRNGIRFMKKDIPYKDMLLVDNEVLMESLTATSTHIEDFYAAPLEALNAVEQLYEFNENVGVADADADTDVDAVDEVFTTKPIDGNVNEKNDVVVKILKSLPFGSVEDLEKIEIELEAEVETKAVDDVNKNSNNLEVDDENELSEFLKSLDDNISEDSKLSAIINIQVECRSRAAVKADEQCLADFERHTPSPLTPTDEFLKPMRDAASKHQVEVRRVHFEDEVGLHKFERENSSCSNTSDGLDSIISDLAEEALYELQMEEQNVSKLETDETQKLEKTQCELVATESHENELFQQEYKKQTLEIIGESTKSKQQPEAEALLIKSMKLPVKQAENNANNKNDAIILSTEDEDDESTVSTHEQNLIIEQLFQSRAQTKIVIMRKYFLKWIHYTTISKIERENMCSKNDRIQQINAFLDKIRKEKVRISKQTSKAAASTIEKPHENCDKPTMQQKENVQIAKKYQSKIKMQQDIIDLQRLKLERQERLIMELKLKKLSDEAKEARQDIKNELKAVIRSGDEKAKAKAKCLQLIGNLRDVEDEDDFKRLRGRALLMPKFLQKMQERALERSIRHEQARQRRLQQEAEREAQKIASEEAKRLEDEEAKRMRIEALKEKRRQEKMAKVLKERERQRVIENNRKAQEFNRRRLLKRIAMEGFKRLLQRKREYTRKCEQLRRTVIKRTYFIAWRDYYRFELTRRIDKADKLHCVLVKRRALKSWLRYVAEERSKYYVACDWYDMKLSTYMFKEWAEHTKRLKNVEEAKTRKANSHYEWNLKFKVLDCWQRLPQILQLEKETEERRQRWRMKIWELLPDYTPRLDSFV